MVISCKEAFDTVDHAILLSELEAYNLDRNALLWFKSYLTELKSYSTEFIHGPFIVYFGR